MENSPDITFKIKGDSAGAQQAAGEAVKGLEGVSKAAKTAGQDSAQMTTAAANDVALSSRQMVGMAQASFRQLAGAADPLVEKLGGNAGVTAALSDSASGAMTFAKQLAPLGVTGMAVGAAIGGVAAFSKAMGEMSARAAEAAAKMTGIAQGSADNNADLELEAMKRGLAATFGSEAEREAIQTKDAQDATRLAVRLEKGATMGKADILGAISRGDMGQARDAAALLEAQLKKSGKDVPDDTRGLLDAFNMERLSIEASLNTQSLATRDLRIANSSQSWWNPVNWGSGDYGAEGTRRMTGASARMGNALENYPQVVDWMLSQNNPDMSNDDNTRLLSSILEEIRKGNNQPSGLGY